MALRAASPYTSKFLTGMIQPIMVNLIKGGKNKIMDHWVKKLIPDTNLRGSSIAQQVYQDIRKGDAGLVLHTLNQNTQEWNLTDIPVLSSGAYSH